MWHVCSVFTKSYDVDEWINDNNHFFASKIIYSITSVLVTNIIEMTTIFHITLRSILIISKCMGLIDISYTVGPTGLFVRNISSMLYVFLEIARMIVLLICTYLYFHQFDPDFHIFQYISIFKFWVVIIAARVSTIWIVK